MQNNDKDSIRLNKLFKLLPFSIRQFFGGDAVEFREGIDAATSETKEKLKDHYIRLYSQRIFIVFNNDSPELAYFTDEEATTEALRRQVKAEVEHREGYPRTYWHTHSVPCILPRMYQPIELRDRNLG